MDKKALQEQFEAIAIQNCWNINKYPAGWDGHGDDEYADDFVSGAWWGFQHQQAKVEGLQKQVTDLDNRATQYALDEMATAKLNGELQKRVDAVKGLAQTLWEKSNEKHTQGKVWESKALGECADEILDVLEQALKREG